jgi:hypothetical protein
MNELIPEGEKRKISYKWAAANDRYTQQHAIDVGDVSDHQIRIYEIQRAWPNSPPAFNGVRVKEERLYAISDYIDINGHSWGYSHYVLENGDKIFARFDGTSETLANPDGSKKHTFTSVVTFTDGTGQFRGIQGIARYTAAFDPQAGLNEGQVEGEYWIAK